MTKVTLIAAMTADGYISRTTDELVTWSSKEDKKLFVEVTKRSGVMIMGHTTFQTIGRALPGRKTIVYSRKPRDYADVEITQEAPAELVARLAADGYAEIAICGGQAIYDMFLQAGLVTDIYLTVEPELFGTGIGLVSMPLSITMEIKETRMLNANTILLHYGVH